MKKWLCRVLVVVCGAVWLPSLSSCQKKQKTPASYEIVAEYSPELATIAGTVKISFTNPTERALDTLKFNLYPNAYRQNALYKAVSPAYQKAAYYNGESYGSIAVLSVNGGKGWSVGGEDKNILSVETETPLYPDEKIVLDISFLTKLASVNHRTGVSKNGVNLGNFFPILCGIKENSFYECVYYSDGDPFYLDCADYQMRFVLPKEYALASTGAVVEEKSLESKKQYFLKAEKVRDFAVFACEKYQTLEKKIDGVKVQYFYFDDERAEENFKTIGKAFAYFSKTFGKYPYPEYKVAQADFCYGGMEYPAATIVSPKLSKEEYAHTLVHETAHQWWYAVVGSDQVNEAWQDEGLCEYSTKLFFDEHQEYGVSGKSLVDDALLNVREYYRVYGSVFGETDTRMTRNLSEYLSEYEYRTIAYDKGMVLFDTVKKSVGKKKFLSALKRYYAENKFKTVRPAELIGAFENTGVDVAGLFDGFLSGKGII